MPPSSIVHCSQHDTNYATFEFLLRAAFVGDEIWGDNLGPARCDSVQHTHMGMQHHTCLGYLVVFIVSSCFVPHAICIFL